MNERENLIWASALLKGEGCFRIKPGSRPGYRDMLVVIFGSTDKDVLDRVVTALPGHGKIHVRTPKDHKTQYSVEWYGKKELENLND